MESVQVPENHKDKEWNPGQLSENLRDKEWNPGEYQRTLRIRNGIRASIGEPEGLGINSGLVPKNPNNKVSMLG